MNYNEMLCQDILDLIISFQDVDCRIKCFKAGVSFAIGRIKERDIPRGAVMKADNYDCWITLRIPGSNRAYELIAEKAYPHDRLFAYVDVESGRNKWIFW